MKPSVSKIHQQLIIIAEPEKWPTTFTFETQFIHFQFRCQQKKKKKCYTADIEIEPETSRSVEQHLKQCWMSHYNKISLPRVKRKRVQRASCVYLTTEWLSLISRG